MFDYHFCDDAGNRTPVMLMPMADILELVNDPSRIHIMSNDADEDRERVLERLRIELVRRNIE